MATSACLLDPRFKGNMFISTANRIAAVEKLRTRLSKINIESEPKENNRPVVNAWPGIDYCWLEIKDFSCFV